MCVHGRDLTLKPRLTEHQDRHTHRRSVFFFLHAAIRNSLRSNKEKSGGEARCFPPYCTRDEEGAQNINQFAKWTNIAAGIHSTTASEFRLFPQLTNSWLLTTDYQYSGYYSCCLEYCLHRTQNTVVVKIGTHLLSGVLSE